MTVLKNGRGSAAYAGGMLYALHPYRSEITCEVDYFIKLLF